MADIRVIGEEGQQLTDQKIEIKNPDALIIPDGVLLVEQVGQLFDLKPSEVSQYKDKLGTLINYAKLKTDDHSPDGLKWALRSLGTKLGTPPLGEKLINYLHIYARLYLEGVRNKEERDKFLRGETDE